MFLGGNQLPHGLRSREAVRNKNGDKAEEGSGEVDVTQEGVREVILRDAEKRYLFKLWLGR